MLNYILAKTEYEERIRRAEQAIKFANGVRAKRKRSLIKTLLSIIARF